MFPAGLEPATFRVLGERDNYYTTKTWLNRYGWDFLVIFSSENIKQGHKHHLTFLCLLDQCRWGTTGKYQNGTPETRNARWTEKF